MFILCVFFQVYLFVNDFSLLIYFKIFCTKPFHDSCHRVQFWLFCLCITPREPAQAYWLRFQFKELLCALTFVKSPAPRGRKKQAIHLLAGGGGSGRLSFGSKKEGGTFPEAAAACFCGVDVALATALDLVDSSTSAYSGVTYHIPCTPLTDHSIVYLFCGSSLSTQERATQQTILCRGAPGNYSSRNSLQEGIFFWILFTLFPMDISF